MSQGSTVLPTTGTVSGLSMTQDANAAFAALLSQNSGSSAPTNTEDGNPVKGQAWVDTSVTPNALKVFDGTNWVVLGYFDASNGLWSPPIGGGTATVTSGSTTDIWAVPQSAITVSGTATITALATTAVAGTMKMVTASGAFHLTHDGTALICPGSKNIDVRSGDKFLVLALNAADVAIVAYSRADGSALSIDGLFGTRNRIINPSGQINQINTASAADTVYDVDMWRVLVETAAVTPSQVTNAENGTPFLMRLTQAQASAQRFGRAQYIESANSIDLRGGNVVLSARVRVSASATLRFAILEWTGTANAPQDPVNNWSSSTFTAGNFFASSNYTVTATGSKALTANTFSDIALATALGSSANNVVVMFWTDAQQAQNVTLDIAKVQFEAAQTATPLALRTFEEELRLCQRYYEKSYDMATAAATATRTGMISAGICGDATNKFAAGIHFRVPKLSSPSVTVYDGAGTQNAGSRYINGSFGDGVSTGGSVVSTSQNGFVFYPNFAPANHLLIHYVADARI
jgi:hypothetical protein